MGLKGFIKKQKLLEQTASSELTLPGEPMIYSTKYNIANRSHSTQFFRNMQWKSILKSYFNSCYNTKTPVVVIVRFYVSPPSSIKISPSKLKKESIPAVASFEVCDYLLSFLEMLHHVLINSYRQIVKLEVEKFYSNDPRTVFKFIKWETYVNLQNKDTIHTESESVSSIG